MKKYFVILLGIFILTGCAEKETVNCNVDGKEAIFTLKNGIISHYKVNGIPKSNSEIAEINGTYFTSSVTNEDAKLALQNYINSIGGTCE